MNEPFRLVRSFLKSDEEEIVYKPRLGLAESYVPQADLVTMLGPCFIR